MPRLVALLRGINVGPTTKVPMAELRALVEGLGYADVRTHLQSGNVLLTAPEREPVEVEDELSAALAEGFGFAVPVLVRTRDELAEAVAANPLRARVIDPSRGHVHFLAAALDPARLGDLDPAAFAPEAFALRRRELYTWTPDGISDSPLVKALGKRLDVTSTARNVRTAEKLLALADG